MSSPSGLTGKTSDFLKIAVGAAGRGDLATVRKVLAERPDWLRRVGSHGRTMLWEAAYRGRLTVVAELLERGADPSAPGCHFTPLLVEITPYCAARWRGHEDVAAMLAARGAAEHFTTAVFLGNEAAVRRALQADSRMASAVFPQHDPNITATALHYAVSPGQLKMVRLLLKHGADPAPHGFWLSRFCIWRDRPDILEALFDAGLRTEDVQPPRRGLDSPRMVALLESRGVDCAPDRAEGGWPPLVFACRGDRGGSLPRVQALLAAGADVGCRNHKGQTALHCAAKAGFAAIVQALLDHGAEVDAADASGQTPLATALRSTVKDKRKVRAVVRLLAAAGADADRADKQDATPRRIATRKRDASAWLAALEGTR